MTVDELMGLADEMVGDAREAVSAYEHGASTENKRCEESRAANRAALETAVRASIATPEVEAVVGAARSVVAEDVEVDRGPMTNTNRADNVVAAYDWGYARGQRACAQICRNPLLALDAARAGQADKSVPVRPAGGGA